MVHYVHRIRGINNWIPESATGPLLISPEESATSKWPLLAVSAVYILNNSLTKYDKIALIDETK